MSDHIFYKEETLSTAAAELDRLANIMSDVTRQLDAVDTFAEWWEHIKGADGESAVGLVRAMRKVSAELDKQSALLAGNVRKIIELFEQTEADAARQCQIDGPARQPPYLDESTGAVAVGDAGEGGWTDRVKDYIWDLLADLIGDASTFFGFATDIMKQVGMIGKSIPGPVGLLASIVSSFLSNYQEYVSAGGAMSVDRAVSEFVLESLVNGWADSFVGVCVAGVATVCPAGAIVIAGVWAAYNLTAADKVTENISDFFLGKEEEAGGSRSYE